ncbi:hypothetical protein KUTeg_007143 [Tegillarca granosa]|uniref:Transmembrane protein 135 N-terminal domain-containing protein n=1 Tax=Tegillarca granosa TaxID=220873 RepID=A0ABQ9FCD9_TEGGR|nr:hypothetical protein KUTeg_007143 [Tegillarca granosa]
MAILSKPTSLEFTCYELGHTWTPSCKKATADVVIQVFKQGLMIYGPLYLISVRIESQISAVIALLLQSLFVAI